MLGTFAVIHRLVFFSMLFSLVASGCSPSTPLKMRRDSGERGPWCAPNQRVQIGQRVVGKVGWGEDKWKDFLLDDAGEEYDPEDLSEEVWSYLESTGDADKIMRDYHENGRLTVMTVVALKPLVVVMETRQLPKGANRSIASPERTYWLAAISSVRGQPDSGEVMRWCSPDLKTSPTELLFSPDGVAEISLTDGKLRFVREGDVCQTTRL